MSNMIQKSPESQAFWEEMRQCLKKLERPAYGTGDLFASAMTLLRSGAEKGDPELMYLWAEFLYWGEQISFYNDQFMLYFPNSSSADQLLWDFSDEDFPDPFEWYNRSAEAGFPPAMYWLGWCAKQGINAAADPQAAAAWIRRANEASPEAFFEIDELDMFLEAAWKLAELAVQGSEDDDWGYDQYGTNWVSSGWREIRDAVVIPCQLCCYLGGTSCLDPEMRVFGDTFKGYRGSAILEKTRPFIRWCLSGVRKRTGSCV